MADRLDGLIFSEFLVDNASAVPGFDTDGDGTHNKSDEYIELQNTTGAPMSLEGYQVWSDDKGLLYEFGSGDTIAPGGTATIVGEYSGTAPAGFYDAGESDGSDFLQDGEGPRFDTIYLVNVLTGEYIAFSYGDPPQPASPPTGFTGTSQVGAGESLNSDAPNGVAFERDSDGDWVEGSPSPGTSGVACYAKGTMIATPEGERAIEDLRAGDTVITLDSGPEKILFMLFQDEDFRKSRTHGPVQIKAGALGRGRPRRDLIVSANHRILVGGHGQLDHLFPTEVFVPAKCLPQLPGIRTMRGKRNITWVHFVLRTHGVVSANGCSSESMLPGAVALSTLKPRDRVLVRSKSAVAAASIARPNTARPALTVRDAERYLRREVSNQLRRKQA